MILSTPIVKPPNILLITSDQQHWSALGCINQELQTPSLDRLAAEGTRFRRAYCPNPTCSPTRASLITGLYPSSHGCWSLGTRLDESVPTLGARLLQHGYDTSLIGKAHFQPLRSLPGMESIECQPLLRNLDYWRHFPGEKPWYGFRRAELARMHAHESHVGQHYAIWLEENGLTDWPRYFQQYPPSPNDPLAGPEYLRDARTWELPERFHHSHWVAERTCAHLESAAESGQPLFVWSSFFDPHPPYVVPEPWASMYNPATLTLPTDRGEPFVGMPSHFEKTREHDPDFSAFEEPGGHHLHGFHSHQISEEELRRSTACYYGMTSLMDAAIGRILDCLDKTGQAENTLVVFTSDHGHFIGQHGLIAKGAFHYEDVVRVPMIVRWPGHVPASGVSDSLQSLVDYPATFLSAAGIPVPGSMQGVDQTPVWTEAESRSPREHVIVENRHNPTTLHLRTFITDRWKLTVYRGMEDGELFDLENDPDEKRNLWSDPVHKDCKLHLMHKFLQAEMEREATPMPRIAGA